MALTAVAEFLTDANEGEPVHGCRRHCGPDAEPRVGAAVRPAPRTRRPAIAVVPLPSLLDRLARLVETDHESDGDYAESVDSSGELSDTNIRGSNDVPSAIASTTSETGLG